MAEPRISIVIPCYNRRATIGTCLQAATSQDYPDYEVIVVDDASTDGSGEIIRGFPVRALTHPQNGGAGKARNTGAAAATGEFLFFTDDDCVLPKDTLRKAARAIAEEGRDCVLGGTYAPLAHDHGLFSSFQSVFVNYSETKYREPDYIATHAMLIPRAVFAAHPPFQERFLPILEDVDYCHRLRRDGVRLLMRPELQVAHIFRFDLWKSMRNAFRKSRWWVVYSLRNQDVLADSGTASIDLKVTVLCWGLELLALAVAAATGDPRWLLGLLGAAAVALVVSRGFVKACWRAGGGPVFALLAVLYWLFLYPLPVALGSVRGLLQRP